MEITRYTWFNKQELLDQMHQVALLRNGEQIYKDAHISLQTLPVSSLQPCQLYEMRSSRTSVRRLERAFQERGIDIFEPGGFLEYQTNEDNDIHTLIPPVIEYHTGFLIVDGLHRISLARRLRRRRIEVVLVKGLEPKYPFLAYPNTWKEVKLVSDPPETKGKRFWSIPVKDAYSHYRDFNSVFENVGQPRRK